VRGRERDGQSARGWGRGEEGGRVGGSEGERAGARGREGESESG
jgi:hypothetical protein